MFREYGTPPKLRVLHFDLENRPLNYLASDWTGAEITGAAWGYADEDEVRSIALMKDGSFMSSGGSNVGARSALAALAALLSADNVIVSGHYVRKHDLPLLNSALMENGLDPLPELLVSDTQADLVRRKDISASQENLCAMFNLPEPKRHMSQGEWREANRLTHEGVKLTLERVIGDVVQHKALRRELIRRRLLKLPRKWRS